MKAISIKQPWAWLILHAGKDIENRKWATNRRERVLLHTGNKPDLEGYHQMRHLHPDVCPVPPFNELHYGGIIGAVTIVGCCQDSRSPWFFGPYGWQLADPVAIPFIKFPGRLRFFDVPDRLVRASDTALL